MRHDGLALKENILASHSVNQQSGIKSKMPMSQTEKSKASDCAIPSLSTSSGSQELLVSLVLETTVNLSYMSTLVCISSQNISDN